MYPLYLRSRFAVVLAILCICASGALAATPKKSAAGKRAGYDFRAVDDIFQQAITAHQFPGAVVLISHNGKVVYKKAFGHRAVVPKPERMTTDTIFDMASLTKCLATTTSVMKLMGEGKVRLNDPISRYIPEFGTNGKQDITVRMLMTHYSGLRPDLDLRQPWVGKETAFRMIIDEKPTLPPGARFVYSDINYEILGFLVERVTGESLDQYAKENVFKPLGMKHTTFLPPTAWLPKIAPTQYDEHMVMLRGIVHDPTARRMGGVAGHAGLFSTADDVARFANAMLKGNKVLDPVLVEKMSTPQQPPTATDLRGLGWDIDSPFSSNRGELLPVGSYGHTGFTGTSLWIDPYTKSFFIILTNAVHPNGDLPGVPKVNVRARVMTAMTDALRLKLDPKSLKKLVTITGYNEAATGAHRPVPRNGKVLNGIDVLEANGFAQLQGKTVGLLTNQTGIDLEGKRTIDVLAHAPNVKLAALFSPEHGAIGALDTTNISNSSDPATGIPIYSVYGATEASRRPPADVLDKLDAVVIDIQDVGARFYTYETSMGYFLEAAAKAGKEVIILDRPNPIGGTMVQGPVSDIAQSYVNYHAIPTRHGMTLGELANFYNSERNIHAKLTVVAMQGYMRGDWFDSTGQLWIDPSPNMRSLTEATLYTGVANVEGTNVSVGRGTDTPFELVGAPWINAREFSAYLNARLISGVRFVPVTFTPSSSIYSGQLCQGVNIVLTDRYALDAPELGLELASVLYSLYPAHYKPDRMIQLLGNTESFQALLAGQDPRRIDESWRDQIDSFQQLREKYLIYK